MRRGLSAQELGRKIGVGRDTVAEAEKGKPSTSVAVYAGLLWALGLIDQLNAVADPAADAEGQTLALRASPSARGGRRRSTMTSKRAPCFVYIWLPGATEAVTAGKFELTVDRRGTPLGRFVYGKSYLARKDAVPIDPVELTLGTARLRDDRAQRRVRRAARFRPRLLGTARDRARTSPSPLSMS